MQINTTKKDIIWNYLGTFFSIGTQVIWMPILVHYLSPDILGLWYVFVSIGALAELLDTGFTPTLSHVVSYAWSGAEDLKKQGVVFSNGNNQPNYDLVSSIMRACRFLFFGIACTAGILMSVAGTIYIRKIAYQYLSWEIYLTWVLYIVATFINLYIGYYVVILVGIGDVYRRNRALILSKGCFLFLGSIGLICGFGIISLGIAYFISGFVLRFSCRRYLLQYHKFGDFYSKSEKYSRRHIISMMWPNAWRDGLVTITRYLNGQATVLLCSNYLNLYETGIYSFSMQVINAILSISDGMMSAYIPAIQSAYTTGEKNVMKNLYEKATGSFYVLSICGLTIFTLIGIPIVRLLRHDFIIQRSAYIVLAFSMWLMCRHGNSTWFISTMNKLPFTFSFVLSGIASIILTFVFMDYFRMGVWGLILGTLIVQSLYNNWKWNYVVNEYLDTNEWLLVKSGIKSLMRKVILKIKNKI